MSQGDFAGHQPMEGVWNDFTTMQDPQMLATIGKGQMMSISPDVWNSGAVPSGIPSSAPMEAQTQPMAAPTYPMQAVQADGSVWQVPPPGPTRAMSYPGQPDMNASYQSHFQQQMPPRSEKESDYPGSYPFYFARGIPGCFTRHGNASASQLRSIWTSGWNGVPAVAYQWHASRYARTLSHVRRGVTLS